MRERLHHAEPLLEIAPNAGSCHTFADRRDRPVIPRPIRGEFAPGNQTLDLETTPITLPVLKASTS